MPTKSISKNAEAKCEECVIVTNKWIERKGVFSEFLICPNCGNVVKIADGGEIGEQLRELEKAIHELRDEILKLLRIPQIVDWLNKVIAKIS